jgi:hypothetical protein
MGVERRIIEQTVSCDGCGKSVTEMLEEGDLHPPPGKEREWGKEFTVANLADWGLGICVVCEKTKENCRKLAVDKIKSEE